MADYVYHLSHACLEPGAVDPMRDPMRDLVICSRDGFMARVADEMKKVADEDDDWLADAAKKVRYALVNTSETTAAQSSGDGGRHWFLIAYQLRVPVARSARRSAFD